MASNPTIDALVTQVTASEDVIASATLLINGIPVLLQAAIDKALAGGATAAQLAPLTALNTDLKAKSDALAAAVAANTDAAPGTT